MASLSKAKKFWKFALYLTELFLIFGDYNIYIYIFLHVIKR